MEEKFKDDIFCENCFEEVPVEEIKKMIPSEGFSKFLKYITSYRLDLNQNSIVVKEAKYLPPRSLVLPGSNVFDIFSQGTQFDEVKDGKPVVSDIQSAWPTIQTAFDCSLIDIASL